MALIEVRELITAFESKVVHNGLNLDINEGEIYGLLGPSGCGKSTLMREMVMLEEYTSGSIKVLGHEINKISSKEAQILRKKWGVLFQFGALFTSLSVRENIALPLKEYTNLSAKTIDEIVSFKLSLVGLKQNDGYLYPSQISGGMNKKAALARSLALDPKLLFLDEPTSGLDPISAREFDDLILKLKDMFNLTIVMVTHDITSINNTLDKMAIIDNKKIAVQGDLNSVLNTSSPFIDTFFKALK